jgi:ribosomal protein L7/L12
MDETQTLIRIAQLERKMSILFQHLGIAEPGPQGDDVSPEVIEALTAGNTIKAIKIHNEQTGVGLGAAKQAVESYWAQREPT